MTFKKGLAGLFGGLALAAISKILLIAFHPEHWPLTGWFALLYVAGFGIALLAVGFFWGPPAYRRLRSGS